MLSIIALIIAIIAFVISAVALIEILPYSDNETICNLQMAIERTIDKLFFEMK